MSRTGILEPSGNIQNIVKLSSVIKYRLGNKRKMWFSFYCYLRIRSLFFYLHDVIKTVGGAKIP